MLMNRANCSLPAVRFRRHPMARHHGHRHPADWLLGDLFEGFPFRASGSLQYPALNASEDEKNLYVEVEMPGLFKDDFDLSVVGKELTISGGREEKNEGERAEGVTVHRSERFSGKFERTVRFGVDIEADQVEAKYKNGILTITLPKAATALPRKIQVKGR